jgi:hypothetical protein
VSNVRKSANRNPQSAIHNPQLVRNPQSAIRNPQSAIHNPQLVRNPQSAIRNPQLIRNPQSEIRNTECYFPIVQPITKYVAGVWPTLVTLCISFDAWKMIPPGPTRRVTPL